MGKGTGRLLYRLLVCLLLIAFTAGAIAGPIAQATMIGTDEVVQHASGEADRERIKALIQRDDVRAQLERLGVDPADAEERVAALSDEEAAQLAERIDELPAGEGIGAIVGAAVLIFLVLLITDLLGLTDVFPFTRAAD